MRKMWELTETGTLLFTGLCAYLDIRNREIPAWILGTGTAAAVAVQVLLQGGDWYRCLLGTLTGSIFFLAAKVTEESIGYGDCWMIVILGTMVGVWKLFFLLFVAFAIAAVEGGLGMAGKKWGRKTRIPFIPCLLAGYVGVLWW